MTKIKSILILILILITTCVSRTHAQTTDNFRNEKNEPVKSNVNCFDLKVKEYYFNDENTFKMGSVQLFSYKNGKCFDVLNKFILKNSTYILNLDSEDDKKFQDWVDHLDLSKIFTLDPESESYQKRYKEMSRESVESLSTEMFCLDKILVYKIQYSYFGDKGSPYFEWLNIDLNEVNFVDLNSLVSINQLNTFNNIILGYTENHKKEIVNNYTEITLQGSGDLLAHYVSIFELSKYDSSKIKCKIDSNNFYHFSPDGIVFNVNVTDKNFLLDKEDPRTEEYVSEITIPYKEVINYLDKNNSLYSSINKLVK